MAKEKINYGIAGFGMPGNKLHLVSQKSDGEMALDRTRSICGIEPKSKSLFNDDWFPDYESACKAFVQIFSGFQCQRCLGHANYEIFKQ